MKIHENYNLKQLNTFGIDANCAFFAEVFTVSELQEVLQFKKAKELKLLVLGGGSNLLITKNLDLLVVKISIKGINEISEQDSQVIVESGAGEVWHEFVLRTLEKGLSGLENLSLIPGCVGASPMQNIGAYGVEIKDSFEYLLALNLLTNQVEKFDLSACEFGYRESVFKRKLKDQYIIVSVAFRLNKSFTPNTSYGAINLQLQQMGITNPSAEDVSDAVTAIRKSKLPDPAEIGNSGSFFKNPTIAKQQYEVLKQKFPEMVAYPTESGDFKLAAGWMIEHAGWKGKTLGNYGVHKKQALVLVNYGGATGDQIYDLSEEIIQSIQSVFGVKLEREVNIL